MSSDRTKVPLPWVVVTRPRSRRRLTARRMVTGLTPNLARNCGFGGQLIAWAVHARPDLLGDGVGDVLIGGLV